MFLNNAWIIHDYEVFSVSGAMGDERRVNRAWPAVGYRRWHVM